MTSNFLLSPSNLKFLTSTFPLLTSNFSLQTSNFLKNVPRNPLLFGIFHRMDLVEKIGSGIKRIRQMCRDYEVAEPVFEVSEHWVTTTFNRPTGQVTDEVISEVLSQPESQPESLEVRVLSLLKNEPLSKSALSTGLEQKEVSGQLNKVIRLLLANEAIEYTIPEKPKSRLQKYQLAQKGKNLLGKWRVSQ